MSAGLLDTIARFASELPPYELQKRSAGSYNADGVWVPGTWTRLQIRAVVTEVRGRDRTLLPERIDARDALTVWSAVDITTTTDGKDADRLIVDGRTYVAFASQTRRIGKFSRVIFVLQEQAEVAP